MIRNSGKNERRSLDGGTGRGAILDDEIIQFVGRRVKRGRYNRRGHRGRPRVRPVALHLREAATLRSRQCKARHLAALVLALCQRAGDLIIVPQVLPEQVAFA